MLAHIIKSSTFDRREHHLPRELIWNYNILNSRQSILYNTLFVREESLDSFPKNAMNNECNAKYIIVTIIGRLRLQVSHFNCFDRHLKFAKWQVKANLMRDFFLSVNSVIVAIVRCTLIFTTLMWEVCCEWTCYFNFSYYIRT